MKPGKLRKWVAALAPFFLVALSHGAGAIELEALLGDWRGEGVVAAEIGKEPERARCKATIEAAADQPVEEVTITGRCAIPAGASRFVLKIVDDGDDRLRAGFRAQRMEETVQMAGERSEDGALIFETREPVTVKGQDWWARVRIELVAPEPADDEARPGFVLHQWARRADQPDDQPEGDEADADADAWRLVSEVRFDRALPSGGK